MKGYYKVFISSTFKDLEVARKEAITGVLDCNHIPIAFETFAPENSSDRDVIKREGDQCHLYVLILGSRYGTIPQGDQRSYTEIEFDHAVESKKYTMVFALNEEEVKKQRNNLSESNDADKCELRNRD